MPWPTSKSMPMRSKPASQAISARGGQLVNNRPTYGIFVKKVDGQQSFMHSCTGQTCAGSPPQAVICPAKAPTSTSAAQRGAHILCGFIDLLMEHPCERVEDRQPAAGYTRQAPSRQDE